MSLINNCRLGEWNVGNVWYNFHARRTPRTIIIFAFGHFASTAACKPIRRFTIRMQFSYILLTHSRYNNCHPSYLILIIFMQRQFVFLLLTGRNDMAAEISDWSPKIKKKSSGWWDSVVMQHRPVRMKITRHQPKTAPISISRSGEVSRRDLNHNFRFFP